jgi:hypothetical protein
MKTFTYQRIFNPSICRILSATCLSALCLIALSTQAATITVNNTNDSGPGSLRQALADALDGDTIDFNSSLNGQTITLTSGQLVVDKSVAINGPGAPNLAVNGNAADRVVYISEDLTVTISGLTIENGNAGGFGGYGGGIFNAHSTLTVSNCAIRNNWALHGGGGIFNYGDWASAALTITNCTISLNSTTSYWDANGGGISSSGFFGSATLEVLNSTVSDNWAANNGGGIFNGGVAGSATLTVNNSTVSGNSAAYGGSGGGLYNDGSFWDFSTISSATMTINKSTVSGNYALVWGGGIYNNGFGGTATLAITNSTLSGNSALYADWVYNEASYGNATLTVNNSTLRSDSSHFGGIFNSSELGSATLVIGNTILTAGSSGRNIWNPSGTVTSLGYNLSDDDGGALLNQPGDQINTAPSLGPLQDNGGPTLTHALLPGSPAIDAGDPNFTPPPDHDQRGAGFPRVFNNRVDIGAFEVQTVAPAYAGQVQPPINPDGSSTFNVRRGVVPVKFSLTLGGVATCDLPPATIAVTRTAGGVIGQVNESVYGGNADTGSNFRIDSCQYIYNLNSRALGVGTYRVDILIAGQVVGNAVFALQ